MHVSNTRSEAEISQNSVQFEQRVWVKKKDLWTNKRCLLFDQIMNVIIRCRGITMKNMTVHLTKFSLLKELFCFDNRIIINVIVNGFLLDFCENRLDQYDMLSSVIIEQYPSFLFLWEQTISNVQSCVPVVIVIRFDGQKRWTGKRTTDMSKSNTRIRWSFQICQLPYCRILHCWAITLPLCIYLEWIFWSISSRNPPSLVTQPKKKDFSKMLTFWNRFQI